MAQSMPLCYASKGIFVGFSVVPVAIYLFFLCIKYCILEKSMVQFTCTYTKLTEKEGCLKK